MSQPPWETHIQPGWGAQPQPPQQPPQPPQPQPQPQQGGSGGSLDSQPPWETSVQPGWGAQPEPPQQPQQPPQQQPQQGGGNWNQGAYAPPQQGGGGYPPPQAPLPPQMGQNHPGDAPAPKGNRGRTFAIIGAVIVLIGAAAGTYLLTKNDDKPSPSPTTQSATPPATATAGGPLNNPSSFPDNSYTGAQSGSPASGSGAGGSSMDSASTDKTPFTQAGLAATTFKDDKGVSYTLKAASAQPCDKVGDAAVTTIVKSVRCTQFMAVSWTDADNGVIVSAMVIPYADSTTAEKIANKLKTVHTGDYNQWCPPAGQPGADACTQLAKAGNVSREGKFGNYHRYVLITTAVYTDLRTDNTQRDALVAAANAAFQNTVPGP